MSLILEKSSLGFVAASPVCSKSYLGPLQCSQRTRVRTKPRPGVPFHFTRKRRSYSNCLKITANSEQFGAGAVGTPVIDEHDGEKLLHIVFVRPQIHWNTGNIGRTCLGLGATLHLVGPLGFSVDEKQVRRAGLDYWQHVDVHVYKDWQEFATGKMLELGGTRFFYTKFGAQSATDVSWPSSGKIVMIFGSEVDGFDGIREWLDTEGKMEKRIAFPMVDDRFRSFNLSTSASMVS